MSVRSTLSVVAIETFLAVVTAILLLGSATATAADTRTTIIDRSIGQSSRTLHAQAWGLSLREWERYKSLMQGPRGLWTPNLDPLYVLGVHAETEVERRRFAELAVQQEHERIDQELAFQREFTAAFTRLYGDEPMIDPAKMGLGVERRGRTDAQRPTKAVLLFAATTGCDGCRAAIDRWVRVVRSDPKLRLAIYLTDTENPRVMSAWAHEQGLSDVVRTGRVVLRPGRKTLALITTGKPMPKLPYTVVQ